MAVLEAAAHKHLLIDSGKYWLGEISSLIIHATESATLCLHYAQTVQTTSGDSEWNAVATQIAAW